ncbi:MAG: hypothetical protein BGO12_13415 [Verrucomicrobia bacterium 61-8]|nr:MAG: hypothetical protein BGO12_13415 [Verrucomicrobia bacterium 61-8]
MMENLFETVLGLIVIAVAGFGFLRIAWAILEVPYRISIIVGCVIAIAVLTVWDWFVRLWKVLGAFRRTE